MSRRKNAVSASRGKTPVTTTLGEMPYGHQVVAAFIGRDGLDLLKRGIYQIASWCRAMAEARARHPNETDAQHRARVAPLFGDFSGELNALILESAANRNGEKVRLLARALELTGPRKEENPIDGALLSLKATGAAPMTARQIRELVHKVQPEKTQTEKTVRSRAKILNVPLVKAKVGAKKGTRQKSVHRARR